MCGEKAAEAGAEADGETAAGAGAVGETAASKNRSWCRESAAVLLRALCRFCTVKIMEERNACYAYSGVALKFG